MTNGSPDFEDDALRSAILRSNQDPIPRRIVLRVFLIAHAPEVYLQRLFREIEMLAPLIARDREVVRLLFDGASPASLQPALQADLMQSLAQHFSMASGAVAAATRSPVSLERYSPAQNDLLGLGLGAVSRFGDVITRNAADLGSYYAALDEGRLPVISAVTATEPR